MLEQVLRRTRYLSADESFHAAVGEDLARCEGAGSQENRKTVHVSRTTGRWISAATLFQGGGGGMTRNEQLYEYDTADLLSLYQELDPEAGRLVMAAASRIDISAHTLLFADHMPCQGVMWLLKGVVRVYRRSPEGRELTLYRVHPGELCPMAIYALFHDVPHDAEACAETSLRGLIVPTPDMLVLSDRCQALQGYLLKDITARLLGLVTLAGDTALQRLKLRLGCLLGGLFERSGSDTLKLTHEAIAHELGTSREVISRLLKQFEHQGCIRLARGQIGLISRHGLIRPE